MSNRKIIDWERIEADYRAGILSIREIAKQNNITDGAIRQKAKAEKWERDLTDKVKQKAATRLLRISTRAESDEQIVDRSAEVIVAVVLSHQTLCNKLHKISDGLANWMLEKLAEGNEEIMPKVADSFSKCSQAAAKYIPLQRQAFNIGESGKQQSISEFLESL